MTHHVGTVTAVGPDWIETIEQVETVWECEQPPIGAVYVVIKETWRDAGDGRQVRTIEEIKLK